LELSDQAVALCLETCDDLAETLRDILSLLNFKTVDFAGLMIDKHLVVLVDSAGIVEQLLQVADVLLDHSGHLFKLRELVTVVVFEHTLGANELRADLAEVLDLLVLMLKAENTRHISEFRLGRLSGRRNRLRLNRCKLQLIIQFLVLRFLLLSVSKLHNVDDFFVGSDLVIFGDFSALRTLHSHISNISEA